MFKFNKVAPVPVVNPYPYIQNYEDIRRNAPEHPLSDFSVWTWAIQQEYERMYPKHHGNPIAATSCDTDDLSDLVGTGVCNV